MAVLSANRDSVACRYYTDNCSLAKCTVGGPVSPDDVVNITDESDGVKRQPADGVDEHDRDHHLHHLSTSRHACHAIK